MTERSYDLINRMRELGAPDPEGWAGSELTEDIAQEARWLLVRAIWARAIDAIRPGNSVLRSNPSVKRLLADGADPDELAKALRYAAHYGVFSTLVEIDSATAMDAPPDAPGWRLMETRFNEELGDHELTGRDVGGLHESINDADPSGLRGGDLFD